MRWIRRDDMIIDSDTGKLLFIVPSDEDELSSAIMLIAPELLGVIVKYLSDIDSNQFKPKKTYNQLKTIVNKIPEYLQDVERLTSEIEEI